MKRMLAIVAPAGLLALTACGDLDDDPLRVGVIQGAVQDAQAGVALASVLGRPELRAAPDAGGHFEIQGVPAGAAELLVVASSTEALRVPAQVPGGDAIDLGTLAPKPAAFVQLHVSVLGTQSVSNARATVDGTPYQALPVAADGSLQVGPLAEGCYELKVTLAPSAEQEKQVCLSTGETQSASVTLAPDASLARE